MSYGYNQQSYGQGQQYGAPQQSYGGYGGGGAGGPPQVPPPWVAEWDARDNRWLFVNRQTGERTFNHPSQGYGGPQGGYGGPPQQQYGGGGYGQQGGYGGYSQAPAQTQAPSHAGRNTAIAAVAGLAGGALLMHEGDKIKDDWDEDKYRMESGFRRDEDRVEDFPDDAARWTGRQEQRIDDIPEDVEGGFRRTEDRIEDIPDDAERWGGRKVQGVEDFGDNIRDNFDDGRGEQRYDDDRRDDYDERGDGYRRDDY